MESTSSMMSKRLKRLPVDVEYINTYSVVPALRNPFNEESNLEGIINLGTAVSGLMDDVWSKRFSEKQFFQADSSHYRYYQFWGTDKFRENIAKFMTRFFNPKTPIEFENLFVLNGAMVSLDILSYLLADEGDSFMCLTPGYTSYFSAGVERWGTKMIPVPLTYNERTGELFELRVENVEKAILEQESKGKIVKAFVFNNPQNPLGQVFKTDLVKDIMKLCQRRGIHLIADEMYCMSVFDKNTHFRSVLQVHETELLNPDRLHIIWGFSKDLCLTGYRTGVIHTYNKDLQLALKAGAQFQAVPLPVMHILENVISDIDWFSNVFVPTNHSRLKAAYEKSKAFFNSLEIQTTTTSAGFFFLVDFRKLFNPTNEAKVKEFIKTLYANKVYLTPSWDIRAEDGWFRFVFTAYNDKSMEIGLRRLKKALYQWKQENP